MKETTENKIIKLVMNYDYEHDTNENFRVFLLKIGRLIDKDEKKKKHKRV